MVIHLDWYDDEQTILIADFQSNWTLDDYHLMVDTGADWINTKNYTVHVIYDFTNAPQSPSNLLAAGRYADKKLPPNQGLVYFVNANVIISAFLSMVQRMNLKAARNVRLTNSVEEAIELIADRVKSLS